MEGITFLNMECVVKNRHLHTDGVHMNHEGAFKFYRKIAVYAQIMMDKREEIREKERKMLSARVDERINPKPQRSRNSWVREESEMRKREKMEEIKRKGSEGELQRGKN